MPRITLFFLLIFFCFSNAMANYACPPINFKMTLDNRIQENNIRYDYNKSEKVLKKLSDKKYGKEITVRGLFIPIIRQETKTKTSWSFQDGCIDSMSINLRADFNSTIYVAKEYLRGTKEFDYILWHEKEHAKITIENSRRYLSYLKKKMERYVSGIRVYPVNDMTRANANIKNINNKILKAISDNFRGINNHIGKLQEEFDEKESKSGKERGI